MGLWYAGAVVVFVLPWSLCSVHEAVVMYRIVYLAVVMTLLAVAVYAGDGCNVFHTISAVA
jgi:hypothetical protein